MTLLTSDFIIVFKNVNTILHYKKLIGTFLPIPVGKTVGILSEKRALFTERCTMV